jgi:hypothetical protein
MASPKSSPKERTLKLFSFPSPRSSYLSFGEGRGEALIKKAFP